MLRPSQPDPKTTRRVAIQLGLVALGCVLSLYLWLRAIGGDPGHPVTRLDVPATHGHAIPAVPVLQSAKHPKAAVRRHASAPGRGATSRPTASAIRLEALVSGRAHVGGSATGPPQSAPRAGAPSPAPSSPPPA